MKKFLMGFVFVVIVGVGVIFIYNNQSSNDTEYLSNDELQELLDKIDYDCNNHYGFYCDEYYSNDIVYASDLSNIFKSTIAKNYSASLKGSEIKKAYEEIYGKGTYVVSEKLYCNCGGVGYNYDSLTDEYVYDPQCGCGGSGYMATHKHVIVSSKQEKDQIKITVVMYNYLTKEDAIAQEMIGGVYTGNLEDCITNEVVAVKKDNESWDELINNNINKLSHYEFTFNKEDNNYIFYSVEKVKG